MAYEKTKEPHRNWHHLNTPKLKNIPSQNYQELSKLKMFRMKCFNNKLHSICNPVHRILFTVFVCIQFTVNVWFTSGSPFVISAAFGCQWGLQLTSAVCKLLTPKWKTSLPMPWSRFLLEYLASFLINSHTTPTTFIMTWPYLIVIN